MDHQLLPEPAPRPTLVIDRPTDAYITATALLDRRQERGEFVPDEFRGLFDTVSEIHKRLDPQDIDRPLDQSSVHYFDGKFGLAFRQPIAEGMDGEIVMPWDAPMNFTGNGLSQFASRVLGSGGGKYVERLRTQGDTGRQLAEVNWTFGLSRQDSPALLRTIKFPDSTYRTVRAVLTGGGRGYSKFDIVDVLDMLCGTPEFAGLPVIESNITIDHARIRFLLNPDDAALFTPEGQLRNPTGSHDTTLRIPVPMGEIGTGEIGQSSTWFNYGTYTYGCLNGMLVSSVGGRGGGRGAGHGGGASWRWTHRAGNDPQKVREGLVGALTSARVESSGMIEDFRRASTTALDDAAAMLDGWGVQRGALTQKQATRSLLAMTDQTAVVNPEMPHALTTLINGITLAAQDESDPFKQEEMERFAHRLMVIGLREASKVAQA